MKKDKRERVYYFPPLKGKRYGNPYSANYRAALSERYEVANIAGAPPIGMSIAFILSVLRADIYIVNWLENIAFFKCGKAQFALVKLGLWIIRMRKARIVWMFHNIHPHGGHNAESRWLHDYLFRHASLIISHSEEAAAYARQRTAVPVEYVCHPVHEIERGVYDGEVPQCDVFMWGSVVAYKGIREFLEEYHRRGSTLKVRIIGGCEDAELDAAIRALTNDRVTYERRRASFEEVEAGIKVCRYVLFPYVGSCVSSSGALIDTIVLGGTSVGPSVGAFADLGREGVCLTYGSYDDLFALLDQEHVISPEQRRTFIARNSWRGLVDVIARKLEKSRDKRAFRGA